MQILKKALSFLLLFCLLLGLTAMPAAAAETLPPETEPDHEEDPAYLNAQSKTMGFDAEGDTVATMDAVPLYLQTDYPNVPYSGGSVATSGCTITAIAMVASYFTGTEILPGDLAKRFNQYDASNLQRMEAASIVLDLPYETADNWPDVMSALEQGKVVIVLLGKASPFTGSQHTVVLAGLTQDGKILVNDPNGPNHARPELKDGFAHGFAPEFVQQGFGGGWIYDRYEPAPKGQSRYPYLELTDEEKKLMASIIWLEARGEPFEGQQAIAEIMLNRLLDDGFPDSMKGIVLAEGQFRTTKFLDDAKPGELQYKAIERAISGPNVVPMDVLFFARYATSKNTWGTIGHHIFCYK